jgi:hypothetical protein
MHQSDTMITRLQVIIGLILVIYAGLIITMAFTLSIGATLLITVVLGLVVVALIDLLLSCRHCSPEEVDRLLAEHDGDTLTPINDCNL